jgi:hypothetical protein
MNLIEDINLHVAQARFLGSFTVPDPEWGDMKLNVFPFIHDGKTPPRLPGPFRMWEDTLAQMMRNIPAQEGAEQFFVTIDTKFFATPGYLRREGVHMDGNFCGDYDFSWGDAGATPKASWGGSPPTPRPTWAGNGPSSGIVAVSREEKPDNSHVRIGFKLPYDITVPLGKYVSGSLGGTLMASSVTGCQAWPGEYRGRVGSGGDWSQMVDQLGEAVQIGGNELWLTTSNCPHETLMIPAGTRRTFMRVTLPHNYNNRVLFS